MELAENQSIELEPGQAGRSSIHAPIGISDDLTWRLINDADGTIAISETSDQIDEIDDGYDPGLRRYDREFTAPVTTGRYLAIWRLALQEIHQTIIVAGSSAVMFATADDVAARLGRTLTTAETGTVNALLEQAATVIADAAGYDDGWAASLSPVPRLLKMMSIQIALRGMTNPAGYSSFRQQVGSYAIETAQPTTGVALSDAEERMVRRAVHGRTTVSVHVRSGLDRAQDEYWLRKQAAMMNHTLAAGETIR